MPSVAATMNSIRESTSIPCLVSDDGITATEAQEIAEKRVLSPSQSFDDTKERSLQHSRVEIVRLAMFRKVCKPLSNNQLLSFFSRECNETSIAGGQKALTRSLDFVKYFIYGNYNVPYYNAADQCIRLSPW